MYRFHGQLHFMLPYSYRAETPHAHNYTISMRTQYTIAAQFIKELTNANFNNSTINAKHKRVKIRTSNVITQN